MDFRSQGLKSNLLICAPHVGGNVLVEYGPEFVDEFLDGFLLNRFGSNVLMTQFLALSDDKFGETGIIDPNCDAAEVCREAASQVVAICGGVRPGGLPPTTCGGGSVRPGGLPLPRATVPHKSCRRC